ncbi:glycoside hydrolase family 3 N-terminal domain-containing protein [Amycolatopsis sp. NPDC051903]|uniref:glycoside hydrolase family 3 N-terminal domain-containing protein n=1 Tax=Amycolatopsis sp. NPDC051903 TaxID=3363936 RepID=UPI0037A78B73
MKMPARMRLPAAIAGALLAGGTLAGCGSTHPVSGTALAQRGASAVPTSSSAPSPAQSSPTSSRSSAPSSCDSLIASLSARERVAQLVVPGVDAANPAAVTKLVQQQQIGGFFVGGNKTTLLQNHALDAVQRAAKIPVSVAVDEEGGRVQRIDDLDGSLPSARQLAKTKTPDEVRALGVQRGEQLRAHGVTVDYAPDTDVSDEPDDAVIGDRSYSSDPATVRKYALAFAEGLRQGGITPVLKHFPGHGHGSGDSHKGTVTTPPLDQLRQNDLKPYENLAGFGAVEVMVGHLDVPGLTNGVPASISPAAYQLLRHDYHFTGPVITDDLGGMKAITDQYPLPDAVLKALQAGADEALFSSGNGDVGAVLDRLVKAVSSGELPADRVAASVKRVLKSKHACT